MATESPIRMMEARQKWPSHKVAATYASSSTTMVDEVHQSYRSGSIIVPNRSGSAPPSIEGSIVAVGNLVSSASHVAGSGSNIRSASFGGSSNDSLHISRGILPTRKEEPEDGKSPRQASVDWTGRNSTASSEQESSASVTRNRSLVKPPWEDSSCPAIGHDLSQTSLHLLFGEASNHDIHHMSQDNRTVGGSNALASSSNTEEAISSSDAGVIAATASRSSSHYGIGGGSNALASSSNTEEAISSSDAGVIAATASRSSSRYGIGGALPFSHKDDTSFVVPVVSCDSHIANMQSGMGAIRISHPPDSRSEKIRDDRHGVYHTSIEQQQTQHPTNLQFQGSAPQIVSQGIGNTYPGINQISTAGTSSSQEVQPFFQSSGVTPSFYAASAAYTPYSFYPTVQTPGFIYPSNYAIGGYGFNTAILPPYYSPHSNVPLTFDGVGTHNYNIRNSVLPSSGSVDMEQFNKFRGPLGVAQPPFIDPYVQLPQPFPHVYNASGQAVPLASKDGVIVGAQEAGGRPNLNQRRGQIASPAYFGTSTTPGAFMHISSSTMGSPVMRAPFIAGDGFPGGRNEQRFSPTGRNSRLYANWPSQRASRNLNSPRTYSIFEELKSGRRHGFELRNVAGHVAELSVDQHGSRFIQQKLEHCSVEEKASVFDEVLPLATKLMTDVFGNYVIQKFFEFGTPEQRKELATKLTGQILSLSLQMYGCRVIQKALDVIELDQKVGLVRELDGHVMTCVHDQNGNHVIQKCIECIPIEKIDFILYAFCGHVADVSKRPYGCRVIQRVLERCTNELQSQFLVDEILESVCSLSQNQYGNYVVQYVLEKGKPQERSEIIRKLSGQIVQMSQHKFASNVIEKCLEYCDDAGRELLIGEIIGKGEGNDNLLIMMKDQYANYVVQKALDKGTNNQRDLLHSRVKGHLYALKKYTYGKHIVSCFEQLFGEETQASGS